MNYKINDSHTDPFYIGFFSVVDFPVSQQFQFDPCSIRKRKPVVIDGFSPISRHICMSKTSSKNFCASS